MKLEEFEKALNEIRAKNGWIIELELTGGLWIISVFDKETRKMLGSTGSTGLEPVLDILSIPFIRSPWV